MAVFLPDEQKYINKLTEIVEENFSNSNMAAVNRIKGTAEMCNPFSFYRSRL